MLALLVVVPAPAAMLAVSIGHPGRGRVDVAAGSWSIPVDELLVERSHPDAADNGVASPQLDFWV